MIPAASSVGVAVKPPQPVTAQTAQRTVQPQAPETARASAGEAAAANVRTETPNAIQAAEQSSVAPRMRDQENAERTERAVPGKEGHTGPPPTFEESPLERQARVAFDPPEVAEAPKEAPSPEIESADDQPEPDAPELKVAAAPADPPPTPTERAEASFGETRALAEPKEPATIDVAR